MSRADCADWAEAAPRSSTSLTTSRKPLSPSRVIGDVRAFNRRLRALAGGAGCGASPGAGSLCIRNGGGSARDGTGRAVSGRDGGGIAPNAGPGRSRRGATGTAGATGVLATGGLERGGGAAGRSMRALRTASASTLRIASSSARRSRVMSASASGGLIDRNCETKAARARSYSARRASPVLVPSPSTARAMSG